MITKGASTGLPIKITASGQYSMGGREIIAIHYLNTTAGVGRVDIQGSGEANRGITLGSDAANGNDHWVSSQPINYPTLTVTFTTGTGVVTIQTS